MRILLKYLLLVFISIAIATAWSFTRSGYIESIYFRPTIISILFFFTGLFVRVRKLKIFEAIALLTLSVFLIFSTYFTHKQMFLHDLPLLPFWATLSFFIGYKIVNLKRAYIILIFLFFVSASNLLYANFIGHWDMVTNKLTSEKVNKNIFNEVSPHILLTKDSTETYINNLKGKTILLEFYRNGCSPCIRQLPLLSKLQSSFNKEDFEVILLNTGRVDSYKQAFTNKHFSNKGIKILYDVDGKLTTHLNIQGVPQQFLVDKNGKIISHIIGSSETTSEDYKFKKYRELISKELKN